MMNNVATFFGGGMNIPNSPEYDDAINIGSWLATNGYEVRCGGYGGLMEAVSKGVYRVSGKVTGYTCATYRSTKGNEYLSETVVCRNIYERLERLIEGSSLFIAHAGGIGTISEIFLLLDEVRKKPIYERPEIVLVGEGWNMLTSTIDQYSGPKEKNIIKRARNFSELVGLLNPL